jgi:hypothetical protein
MTLDGQGAGDEGIVPSTNVSEDPVPQHAQTLELRIGGDDKVHTRPAMDSSHASDLASHEHFETIPGDGLDSIQGPGINKHLGSAALEDGLSQARSPQGTLIEEESTSAENITLPTAVLEG